MHELSGFPFETLHKRAIRTEHLKIHTFNYLKKTPL